MALNDSVVKFKEQIVIRPLEQRQGRRHMRQGAPLVAASNQIEENNVSPTYCNVNGKGVAACRDFSYGGRFHHGSQRSCRRV